MTKIELVILGVLIFNTPIFAKIKPCQSEKKILQECNMDLDTKTTKGWIRLLQNKSKMETKFYELTQNSSGGDFETNDKLCHRLIIEATSEEDAFEVYDFRKNYYTQIPGQVENTKAYQAERIEKILYACKVPHYGFVNLSVEDNAILEGYYEQ